MSASFEEWFGLYLLAPKVLWLALLIPLAWVWRARRGEPAVVFAPLSLFAEGAGALLPRSLRQRLRFAPRFLQGVGLLAVILALAGPVERLPDPVVREGIDILLVLDRSSSMAERDLDPERTRLDVARATAARFVREREGDRIGILTFARFPDVVCPPTLDHAAVETFLAGIERVDRDSAEDQTGIGTALARGASLLADLESPSRVLVVLTDGEENVADEGSPQEIEPMEAAELCVRNAVRVHAIQAGRERTTAEGAVQEIEARALRAVAQRTGGRFFEAQDASALAAVYDAIDALERTRDEEERLRLEPRFHGFVAVAFALLLLAWWLERTWLEVSP